jgi:hypothetical protein
MRFDLKKYLPHLTAIVVFAIVTLIYFKPLLSGKELQQHDIAMHKGMSKEIVDYREKYNAEPLWTNSMFGGMPAYQVSTKYPGNWLGNIDSAMKLFLPHPGAYLFLYCLGFFILLLCFEVEPWLALLGGLAYGLSTYFLSIIGAGHNSKANALGYLPALIGGMVLIYRQKHWIGFSVTALFTALELNANHVQIAYYGYMTIGFLLAGYFIIAFKEKKIPAFFKSTGFFVAASFIGVLPNAGNLMTTNEYGKLSNRGKAELTINADMSSNKAVLSGGLDKDYATGWSYGVGETFSFLIPSYKGGGNNAIGRVDPDALKKVGADFREMVSNSDVYFGDQPGLSAPDYIGAIVIFLAVLGMFIIRTSLKWPLFFVCLLTIALGWGHNLMGLTSFFMDHVPGYNKFRAVSMIMIVPELILPLLAILGLQELVKIKSWDEKVRLQLFRRDIALKRVILISATIVGGFCLISYLAPELFNTFHSQYEDQKLLQRFVNGGYPEDQAKQGVAELLPQIEIARKAIFRSDSLRSLIFILLGLGVIYLYFTRRIKRELLFATIGFFIFVDLWSVDRRYLNDKSFVSKAENQEYISGKSAADEEILKDTELDYRVLNLSVSPFDDASTSFYHKSIGGYHGAKLRRYVDLVDFHLKPEIKTFYKNIGTASSSDSALNAVFAKLNVINMLNTKYFIVPVGEEGKSAIPLKNPQANGNAWFVNEIKTVQSADSEIVSLWRMNTKTQAVINEKFKNQIAYKSEYDGKGRIQLISYKPNELEYKCETPSEQFAVFSEIYYQNGWNAYVDGKLQPHAQVNYVLRGMPIPAGKHSIVFRFEPATYKTGNSIALAGSVLLILSIGAGFYMQKRNNVIVS